MDNLLMTLTLLAVMAVFAGIALWLAPDREDLLTRSARTFAQTGLTLILGAAMSDVDMSVLLNVVMPAMTAAVTVIHGAVQPADVTRTEA